MTRAKRLSAALLSGGRAGDAGRASGRRIFLNIGVQLIARVGMIAVGIVTVAVMARSLGVSGFGTWTGASAYVGLFGTLTELGLTSAALLGMSGEPEREDAWLGALFALRGILSFVATLVCAALIPLVLSNTEHAQQVALILSVTLLSGITSSLMTVYQARLRMEVGTAIGLVQNALWTGSVILMAAIGANVTGFAWAWLAVGVVMAGLQLATVRRHAHIAWRAGRVLWRRMASVALPLGISSVLIIIYYRIDAVLLLQIAGPHEAGLYGAAYRFLDPLTAVPAMVMGSFFPVLSAVRRRDPGRVHPLVQTCADYMTVLSLPALATTLVLSHQIVHFVYGPGFGRAAGVLPILMGAFVSICFGSLAGFLAPLLNLQWRMAIYSGIGAAANVALNLVLIPSYGAYGSAWATLVTEVLTMSLLLTTGLRALGLRLGVRRIVRTVAAATMMAGAMVLAKPAGLFPALVVGTLVYAGALLLLRVVTRDELRSLRAERVRAGSAPQPAAATER